jgi:hypothetical protein
MRNPESDIPIDAFCSLQLEMVCITQYNVYLHFSGAKPMLSTSLDCIFDGGNSIHDNNKLSFLSTLLGKEVKSVNMERGPDVQFVFLDDQKLLIRNLHANTESYTLAINGHEYVV